MSSPCPHKSGYEQYDRCQSAYRGVLQTRTVEFSSVLFCLPALLSAPVAVETTLVHVKSAWCLGVNRIVVRPCRTVLSQVDAQK